jgi:DNA-directed RNA polymerase subunit H (RpoH/RPB5)
MIYYELLLNKRNYTIKEKDDNVIIAYNNLLDKYICVFISNVTKLNIESIKDCIKCLKKIEINHAILIYKNIITPAARKACLNLVGIKIELFTELELSINIFSHKYVHLHEYITEEEREELMNILSSELQLPKIKKNDIISRWMDYQTNDIIKITRKNGYIGYRIVV